jgi:hypothetical protein
MTNGTGGPHGKKKGKNGAAKKVKVKDAKATLKRKGWLPSGVAPQGKDG